MDGGPARASVRAALPPLVPPFRFAIVEAGVLRGAHPTLCNFRFLRRLHLRTIVSLMPEASPPRDLSEFCAHQGVRIIHHRVPKYDDNVGLSVTDAHVAGVLRVLADARAHPVFVHCRDGGHNTGLVVMCLRRLQHWSAEAASVEHRRYTKGNELHYRESLFVEAFTGPVRLPAALPPWLWGGVRRDAHPSIQLLPAGEETGGGVKEGREGREGREKVGGDGLGEGDGRRKEGVRKEGLAVRGSAFWVARPCVERRVASRCVEGGGRALAALAVDGVVDVRRRARASGDVEGDVV